MAAHVAPRVHQLPSLLLSIVVLFAIGLGGGRGAVASSLPSVEPVITVGVSNSDLSGLIVVIGHGFTPGGRVYVAIYDVWGMTLHETRWIGASTAVIQPPQGLEPGTGFSVDSGGNIGELFTVALPTIDAPTDSQNPALGGPTGHVTTMDGVDCGTDLMVRAYDRSAATWSGTVEITVPCTS